MLIVELAPLSNGAHRSQCGNMISPPEGWVEIDESYQSILPFIDLSDNGDGTYTVTENKAAREAQIAADEANRVEPEPTPEEQLRADVDYIATLTGVEL